MTRHIYEEFDLSFSKVYLYIEGRGGVLIFGCFFQATMNTDMLVSLSAELKLH